MPLLARLRSLRDSLLHRYRLETELDAELRVFVDEMTERHVADGMTPDAARRAALLDLGGVEQVKERVREVRLGNGLETTLGDLRQAWRGLRRAPGFAAVAILTLGLGIGATTAIFSLVNALLLDELPFRDARQLVFVWSDLRAGGYPRGPLAGPELQALRERGTLFSGFGGIWSNTAVLTGDDPEQLRIGLVTSDFFRVLGAAPALGRTFRAEDDARTAPHAILLSDALWQRRFGGDPSLVGRTIQVDNQPTVVVGVMPARFRLLLPPDASVPDDLQAWLLFDPDMTKGPRGAQFLRVVGRMQPGVALRAAQQQIAAIAAQVGREEPYYGRLGLTLYGVGLHADGVRDVQPTLLALFAGVSLLLVVACVNVASLLVARAAARGRETALRVVLGAGPGRLFRQYAIEGLVLGGLGGLAGLGIGRAGLATLIALRPATLGRMDAATIDPTVLAFTAGTALTWGFLLSLAPLAELRRMHGPHRTWRHMGSRMWDHMWGRLGGCMWGWRSGRRADGGGGRGWGRLHDGGRGGATALSHRHRAALVVCQLALSVVLLVGAGLLVHAFLRLASVDPGFSSDQAITFRLSVSGDRYDSADATNALVAEFRARLAALPDVTAAGAISHLPYDDLPNWSTPYLRDGDPLFEHAGTADSRSITPGFFEAIGARLVAGRFFTEADAARSTPVAIVDERFAQRLWPGEPAIGQRIMGTPVVADRPAVTLTVVGVVRHLRHRRPTGEVREQLYFPVRQGPRNPMAYVVRTTIDTADPAVVAALATRIRETLAALDPRLPIYDVRPLSAYVEAARAARRFTTILAAAFALVALVLAGMGVYGVTAYAAALRRREFGVRLALGATHRQLVRLVMSESTRLAVVGLILGLIGAAIAASLLRAQLYGVTPADPIAYAVAVPTLTAAVALAAWLPARRATRLSPVESLRME